MKSSDINLYECKCSVQTSLKNGATITNLYDEQGKCPWLRGLAKLFNTALFNINLVLGHAPCEIFYVSYSELSTDYTHDIFEIILGSGDE